MRRSVCQRIARLEERAGIGPNLPPTLVVLYFDHVEHDGRKWQREPEETERDFQGRVVRDLRSTYASPFIFMCFGHKPAAPPDAS
jgi:hypothetical protein